MSCYASCCTPYSSYRYRYGYWPYSTYSTYGCYSSCCAPYSAPKYTHTTYEPAGVVTDYVPRVHTTYEPVTTYSTKVIPQYKYVTERTEYVTTPVKTIVEEKVVDGLPYYTPYRSTLAYSAGCCLPDGTCVNAGDCTLPCCPPKKDEAKAEDKAEEKAEDKKEEKAEGVTYTSSYYSPYYSPRPYYSPYYSSYYNPYRYGYRSYCGLGCC